MDTEKRIALLQQELELRKEFYKKQEEDNEKRLEKLEEKLVRVGEDLNKKIDTLIAEIKADYVSRESYNSIDKRLEKVERTLTWFQRLLVASVLAQAITIIFNK